MLYEIFTPWCWVGIVDEDETHIWRAFGYTVRPAPLQPR